MSSRLFTTPKGFELQLKPVSGELCNKIVRQANAFQKQSEEAKGFEFLYLFAELVETGVTKWKLTREQQALVTLARLEFKRQNPGFNKDLSDFTFYVLSLFPSYGGLIDLALAILDVTRTSKLEKKQRALPFGWSRARAR